MEGGMAVGHPFDTIKVRLQTSPKSRFKGPLDCVLQTLRKEGVRGVYKGATPPLVGWMFMDSMYAALASSLPGTARAVADRLLPKPDGLHDGIP
jgi:solute carrier family 25 (mitochondrial carnitine/acylcarnitine transporter), member 20/29